MYEMYVCEWRRGGLLQSMWSSEDKPVVLAFSFHCYIASKGLTQDVIGLETLPTETSHWPLIGSKFIESHFTDETYVKKHY